MLEAKLELAVNELINNYNPRKKQILLHSIGEILLNISYFKMFMKNYPELGPLIYPNLVKSLSFKKYKEKTIIWDYNDPVDGVYIILSGEVKIFKQPNKINLIRCKKMKKNIEISTQNINNNAVIQKILSKKTNNIPLVEFHKFPIHLLKTRSKVNGVDLYKRKKLFLNKKNKLKKFQNCPSAKYLNILSLDMNEYKNISIKEQQVSLTDKNYIYKEPQESRKLDYIEHFGQMIGEDALLRDLKNRNYACETSNKCVLAFLSEKNYHIFFDSINNTNREKIISFLYQLNYFNNKNDFIHKLSKLISIKRFKKGNFIYEKNMPFLNMYILKSGKVSINMTKTSKYKSNLDAELIINSYKDLKKNNSLNDIHKIKEDKHFKHFTIDKKFMLNGEYNEKKVFTLISYEKGEIFGNIEYYLNLKKYMFSVKCLTDVELYEIEVETFKKKLKPYNIEFFEQKTRHQIKFFSKRIKEIYLGLQKDDAQEYKTRNKFMRNYCYNHPLSSLKINEKYINNEKYPLPINVKYESKNFKKTKISPFFKYEVVNALEHFKNKNKKNLKNLFITNNIDFTNSFISNKFQKNCSLNYEKKVNSKGELINLSNILKYKGNETKIIKNKRKNNISQKFIRQIKNLNQNKLKESNCYSSDSRFYNIKKRNKMNLENNKFYKKKESQKVFDLKYIQNQNKSVDFINKINSNIKKVQKENLEKKTQDPKEKKEIVKKKEKIDTFFSYKGYQNYLNMNKKNFKHS